MHPFQFYTVFKGITSVVYAALWLYYLQQLTTDDPNASSQTSAPRCRDVEPVVRNVLQVLAWVSIVFTVIYVCSALASVLLHPSAERCIVIVACLVIVFVYAYQIQYLRAVAQSSDAAGARACTAIERRKRDLVYVFVCVVLVFGVLMVGFGLTGGQWMERLGLDRGGNGKERGGNAAAVIRKGKKAFVVRRVGGTSSRRR